jgi:hypothetical protein
MTKRELGKAGAGRFGVLFPDLPRMIADPKDLHAAGALGGPMDEGDHGPIGATTTPVGYVFLGQFIDHDITLDITSSLDTLNDPSATKNFRTPALDLDLLDLPSLASGPLSSLATRNLLRAQSFGLPSGQNVHAAISEAWDEELPKPDLSGLGLPERLVKCTLLWLYILAESSLSNGQHLGPVGGRIVAEVLIGLLECDNTSYLGSDRAWTPHLSTGEWDMSSLIAFAGYGG